MPALNYVEIGIFLAVYAVIVLRNLRWVRIPVWTIIMSGAVGILLLGPIMLQEAYLCRQFITPWSGEQRDLPGRGRGSGNRLLFLRVREGSNPSDDSDHSDSVLFSDDTLSIMA